MLSELDRRTIGQLSIPRNVPDVEHLLRVDPHTQSRDARDVAAHLGDLSARGLVKNLGSFDDAVKIAAAAEKDSHALTMPDDQADIYSRRLNNGRFGWRIDGDVYVVTDDGVQAMHEWPEGVQSSLPPELLQGVVDAEWARTLKGVTVKNVDPDKHGEALKTGLLEDEFLNWFKLVSDACAKSWGGKRPRGPLAGGAGKTDGYENLVLDATNQKTALGAVVDPWFMALSIFAYTDTDTGATHGDATRLPTYTGYAAASTPAASFAAAAAGTVSNTAAITFAACSGGTSAIIGFGNNSVVGNITGTFRVYGACASTTVSATQTPATFAIGALVQTED